MNVPMHNTLMFFSEMAISDLTIIPIYLNNLPSWYFYIQNDTEFSILFFMIIHDSDKNIHLFVHTHV